MAEKRPALPLVLTANELLEGHSVYFDGEGWTRDFASAFVARDDAAGDTLETKRARADAGGEVVEPYLSTVALDAAGAPLPRHYREKIRVTGPTFRDDFGRNPAGTGAI